MYPVDQEHCMCSYANYTPYSTQPSSKCLNVLCNAIQILQTVIKTKQQKYAYYYTLIAYLGVPFTSKHNQFFICIFSEPMITFSKLNIKIKCKDRCQLIYWFACTHFPSKKLQNYIHCKLIGNSGCYKESFL